MQGIARAGPLRKLVVEQNFMYLQRVVKALAAPDRIVRSLNI
jgi:hypothetical protein